MRAYKVVMFTPQLTFLLPVRNAQSTLMATVQRLLEVLPELTHEFEVLIIDDGSTDATCEVAYELARDFPQLQVARHATATGWAAAVATEAISARGEFLMIHAGGAVETDDLIGLWRLRHGIAATAIAKAQAAQAGKSLRFDLQYVPKYAGESKNQKPSSKIRKSAPFALHARAPGSNLLLIHRQQLGQLKGSLATVPTSAWPADIRPGALRQKSPIKKPSFLTRLKAFTWGE
jgi:glycosyltransferase involved in cell wall biosynthesis